MMTNKRPSLCRMLVPVLILIFSATACTNTVEKAAQPVAESKSGQTLLKNQDKNQEIKEKILAAIEAAKAEGKTSVDVYLDETPGIVQAGDLVMVSLVAQMDGNALFKGKGPQKTIIAGKKGLVPGLGQAVLNMGMGETKHEHIENAFGGFENKNVKAFSSTHSIPMTQSVSAKVYEKKFKALPVVGAKVRIVPYFDSQVVAVDDKKVQLEHLPEDGFEKATALGTTRVLVKEGQIYVRLNATPGAVFKAGGQKGRVLRADPDRFWVDFNHPLAGRALDLDIQVSDITKASALGTMHINWIEDQGFAGVVAKKHRKNQVLVLYADWCSWCEKMFSQTFEDPRLRGLKDKFVWLKLNSDKDLALKQSFGQQGFPMTVLLDDKGNILKKMEGFKTADQMLAELEALVTPGMLSRADKTEAGN